MLQVIQIKQLVENLLSFIPRNEERFKDTPEKSFLYKMYHGKTDGNFDFYVQAKSVFTRMATSPNQIRVYMEYPKDKSVLPCYVVREPARKESPFNSIGKMTGQIDPYGMNIMRDSRQANFEILCFSENTLETIIMAETLYALFMSIYNVLAANYSRIDFGMSEIMMNHELIIPVPILIRSLSLDIVYDEFIPEIDEDDVGEIKRLVFEDAGLAAAKLMDPTIHDGMPGAYSDMKGKI